MYDRGKTRNVTVGGSNTVLMTGKCIDTKQIKNGAEL